MASLSVACSRSDPQVDANILILRNFIAFDEFFILHIALADGTRTAV
jgi:hypothetical protein